MLLHVCLCAGDVDEAQRRADERVQEHERETATRKVMEACFAGNSLAFELGRWSPRA